MQEGRTATHRSSIAPGILALAWPTLCGQLAVMAYGVIDTIMTGHASAADLAAMGVGASVYASVFMSLMGVVSALNPIIAQHYGAQRERTIGASYVQGLWLGLLLSAVGFPLLAFPELWLAYVAPAPNVKALVTPYLRILSLALPASLMFRAMYALNTAVSRPKVTMALQVIGLVLKIALNAVLVFGHLGLPKLGAVGCALASLIVYWALFLLGWAYTHLDPSYRRFAIRFAWPRWVALKEQLHLGVPMGLSYALEATSFTFMALLIARLGTSVMGGHQIVMNLAALCYQLPFALAVATATLTAQALGADDRLRARKAAFTGMRIGVSVAALSAFTVWALRRPIVELYTNDDGVATVALSLIGYMISFHVFDALQGITGFVLRAYKIAIVPTVIYGVALWGLGLVGGYFVAFYPVLGAPRGAAGMWLMQAVALGLTSLLLLSFYLWVLKQQRPAASWRAPSVRSSQSGLMPLSSIWAGPTIVLATAVGLVDRWRQRPAQRQLKQATLRAALDVYKAAWEQQDAQRILTIFTTDAVYHERVLQEPIRGHEGIAAYWQEKVLNGQDRISFTLLNTYIVGTTGIAEWEVYFDDCLQRKRKHMKEIAILEFVDGKIASLREYWASEVIGEL